MKTFISSLVVFACIIIGVSIYATYLNNVAEELEKSLEILSKSAHDEDWVKCKKEIDDLSGKWSKNEAILAMFNDHEDVDNLKLSINELKKDVSFKDKKHIFKTLTETKILLERLKKNETLTLENVLGLAPKDENNIVCYNRSFRPFI